MSDEAQIRALLAGYADRFDRRDADGFAELFAEDAVLVPPGGREIIGLEKITKAVRNMPPGGRHLPGDAQIQVTGDRAVATSRYRAEMPDGGINEGRYDDEFVRTPSGWRFALRRVVVD